MMQPYFWDSMFGVTARMRDSEAVRLMPMTRLYSASVKLWAEVKESIIPALLIRIWIWVEVISQSWQRQDKYRKAPCT